MIGSRFWSRVYIGLFATGVASFGGIAFGDFAGIEDLKYGSLLAFIASIAAAFVFISRLVGERRQNKLLANKSGEEVVSEDRPYFLYLRSFADERNIQRRYRRTFPAEEEKIASAFEEYGSIVAIRDPSAELPALGAALIRASDATWQQKIEQLVQGAAFVIIRLGGSAGVLWELRQVIRQIPPSRVVLLNALNRPAHAAATVMLDSEFGIRLPPHSKLSAVTFNGRWEPTGHSLRTWMLRGAFREFGIQIALRAALVPFLRNLGFEANFPRIQPGRVLGVAFSLLIFALIIYGAAMFPLLWLLSGVDATASVGFLMLMGTCAVASVGLLIVWIAALVRCVNEIWFPQRLADPRRLRTGWIRR